MEINIRRKCEVGARGSLFWDLVGTASFRLFSGNAVNNWGEATKAAGRWRLHRGFWNTHYAQRSSHGETHVGNITGNCAQQHRSRGEIYAINKWKVTHDELCAENCTQKITRRHKCIYAQTLPYNLNFKWEIIVSGKHRHWKPQFLNERKLFTISFLRFTQNEVVTGQIIV